MNSDETLLDEPTFRTGIQGCNLTEINGSLMKDKKTLLEAVKYATVAGTLQAGFTDFKHIKDVLYESIAITEKEALLGVSITGWTNQPWLFNAEVLKEAAQMAKKTNEEVANLIYINPSARITTVKPSGNASVILGCGSGIHPEHSEKYFRVMQLNKETETAKYLSENMDFLLEESVYSETKSDWAVFVPIENNKGTLYKNDLQGIKHLELIKLVQQNWVKEGKTEDRCIIPTLCHNVSNTVIIDDYESIINYLYEGQDNFTAVSFLSLFGDKDWNQSPNTSVLTFEEINQKYGRGAMFASGLIVDGLHYFGGNLWDACDYILDRDKLFSGTREQVLLKKLWVESAKRFAKNYFKKDLQKMIYCLKDVHLLHKWEEINRKFKNTDFVEILKEPQYVDIDTMGAASCNGKDNSCEVVF
jgi:ribonucleoside-diphosphate reductase alpha chain